MKVLIFAFGFCALFLHDVSCQSQVGPLVTCSTDSDCSTYTGTYCGQYSGCLKCVCQSTGYGYDTATTSCLATVNIEASCTSSVQCPDSGAGTQLCTNNACACASGYIASSDKTTCRKSYIDEKCSADSDCFSQSAGATCTNSVCTCPSTSSGAATDKKSCNSQIIGGTCNSTTDCITNAVCNSSACECQSPNTQISTSECRLPRWGQTCSSSCDTTFDPRLTCSSSNCTCTTGYTTTVITDLCAKVNIGSTCVDGQSTCGIGASCTSGASSSTCTCTLNWTTKANGYDCEGPKLGASCTVNATDCTGTEVDTTCPASGKCVCATNRTVDTSDSTACRKALYDESCINVECDTYLECNSATNKCVCTTGNVYDSTILTCRNTAAETAVTSGNVCTVMPNTFDWTSASTIYKRCDPSLTGTSALTCMQCDSTGNYTCNTAIQDPSASAMTHANIALVLMTAVLCAV